MKTTKQKQRKKNREITFLSVFTAFAPYFVNALLAAITSSLLEYEATCMAHLFVHFHPSSQTPSGWHSDLSKDARSLSGLALAGSLKESPLGVCGELYAGYRVRWLLSGHLIGGLLQTWLSFSEVLELW